MIDPDRVGPPPAPRMIPQYGTLVTELTDINAEIVRIRPAIDTGLECRRYAASRELNEVLDQNQPIMFAG